MEKQDLIVNCSVCDARNVTEETLLSYRSITINTGILLSNARSRQLFAQYPITLDSTTVLDWNQEEAPDFSTQNGSYELKSSSCPAKPSILAVNGKLTISPDAGPALSSYVRIVVNGTVYCPESLSSSLGNMEINGKLITYPDAAILTKTVFLPNRYFHRTAVKGGLYFTPKLLVLLDPELLLSALLEKEVRFSSPKVLLHDKDLETVLELLENRDTADLVILPDNASYADGDAVLDETFLQKYGPSFYLDGDLTLNQASTPLIPRLESPHINGTVLLAERQKEAFLAVNPEYKKLEILQGQILTDRLSVTIDQNLLSLSPDGISCNDCVTVKLDPSITPEEILSRLHISDCVTIICTEEQKSAVAAIATDYLSIRTSLFSHTESLADSIMGSIFGKGAKEQPASSQVPCIINATTYVL